MLPEPPAVSTGPAWALSARAPKVPQVRLPATARSRRCQSQRNGNRAVSPAPHLARPPYPRAGGGALERQQAAEIGLRHRRRGGMKRRPVIAGALDQHLSRRSPRPPSRAAGSGEVRGDRRQSSAEAGFLLIDGDAGPGGRRRDRQILLEVVIHARTVWTRVHAALTPAARQGRAGTVYRCGAGVGGRGLRGVHEQRLQCGTGGDGHGHGHGAGCGGWRGCVPSAGLRKYDPPGAAVGG